MLPSELILQQLQNGAPRPTPTELAILDYLDTQHLKRYGSPKHREILSLKEYVYNTIKTYQQIQHSDLLKKCWRVGKATEIIAVTYELALEKKIIDFIMEGTKARFYQIAELPAPTEGLPSPSPAQPSTLVNNKETERGI